MLSRKRLRPRRSFEFSQCLHRRATHIRIRVPEHRHDGGGVLCELNRLQLAKRINRRVAHSRNRVPEQHGDGFGVLGENRLLQSASFSISAIAPACSVSIWISRSPSVFTDQKLTRQSVSPSASTTPPVCYASTSESSLHRVSNAPKRSFELPARAYL